MKRVEMDAEPLDLLPEFCVYHDEGCRLTGSCLECPFPRCVEDRPRGRRKLDWARRDREISRMHLEEKKTVREIAAAFNITVRAVYGALKRSRMRKNETV